MDLVLERLEEFAKTYSLDKLPKLTSSNYQEREDAQWLADMISAKAGLPSPKKWWPILEEIACSIGWDGIFSILTEEQQAIEHFRQFVLRYKLTDIN